MSAWIKLPSCAGTLGTTYLVAKSNGGSQEAFQLFFHGIEDKYILQLFDGSNGGAIRSSTSLDDGNWHSIVGIRDSTMQMYVDGVLIAPDPWNIGTGPWAVNCNNNLPLTIFGDSNHGNLPPRRTIIDDVRIYNRVLTASEISAIYNLYK